MKDVGEITRVKPDHRVQALIRFNTRLSQNQEVITRGALIIKRNVLSSFYKKKCSHVSDHVGAEQLGPQI